MSLITINYLKMGKQYYNKICITLGIILIVSFSAIGQNADGDCASALKQAEQEYKAGRFAACLEVLSPCISSIGKDAVFEAYRLQALCYMFLNDDNNLHLSAVKLLKSNPKYRNFPYFDPVGFKNYLANYDVFPKLELGFCTGFNINSVRTIKNYSVTLSDAQFLPRAGFQVGFKGAYSLKRDLSLNAGILLEGLSYAREASNVLGWNQLYEEKMRFVSIPVSLQKNMLDMNGWTIAGELGLQCQFLAATNSNVILINNENKSRVQLTENHVDVRQKLLFYGLAGLNAKHSLAGGTVSLNIRYAMGLNNVVNANRRWDNTLFIFSAQYVDSDMSFNPLYISLGYQVPLRGMYSVKK